MSTKCTIGYSSDFHLYEEICDSKSVWLQLDLKKSEMNISKYKDSDSITLSIDVKMWRQIVEAWNNSYWGKNPSKDYEEFELDNSYLEKLASLKKNDE